MGKTKKKMQPSSTPSDGGIISGESFDEYYKRISSCSKLKRWLNIRNNTEYRDCLKAGWDMWHDIVHKEFGVEYDSGNLEILFLLLGTNNLTILKVPWQYYSGDKEGQLVEDADLQKILKRFNEEMFYHRNKGRKMLLTGPPSFSNFIMDQMADDEDFSLILERADAIGKLFNERLEISNFVLFGYEEGDRNKQHPAQGGSKPHEDDFPNVKSEGRATDQISDPPGDGKKILSFHVQDCKSKKKHLPGEHNKNCCSDSVSFRQPHAVVVFMTKLCAGNFFGQVLHSSEGGGGTDLMVIDYQVRTSERTRPKALRKVDAKNAKANEDKKPASKKIPAPDDEDDEKMPASKKRRGRRT